MNVKKGKTSIVTDSLVIIILMIVTFVILIVIIIITVVILTTQGEGDNCPKEYNANQLDSDKDGEDIIYQR